MDYEQLNRRAAELYGIITIQNANVVAFDAIYSPEYQVLIFIDEFHPASDLNHAAVLKGKIARLGLIDKFMQNLVTLFYEEDMFWDYDKLATDWTLVNATGTQITQAFIAVMEDK